MLDWLIAIFLLVESILLPAWLLWWVTQRTRFREYFHSLAGVATPFAGLMGVLFSLNLVFVCNEIWQSRETAKLAMSREAEALRNIGRIASNMPDRSGVPVLEAARKYLEAVNELDFADKASQRGNQLAAVDKTSLAAVIKLSDAILSPANLDKLHPTIQPLLIAQLTAVRDKRLERVSLTNITPSRVKWIALIFLECITVLSIALVHITQGRAMFVACLVYLLGVNPVLAALYASQSPFAGLDPLKPTPLVAALDRLKSMEDVYKKK